MKTISTIEMLGPAFLAGYVKITSIERKPRVLIFEASKGEAVVDYCEPLATKKMSILSFPKGK